MTKPAPLAPGTTAPMELDGEALANAKASKDETFEQKAAFEEYWKLGNSRSLVKTAEKVSRHITTIEKWSSTYRWSSRIRERENYQTEYQKSADEAIKEGETMNRIGRLVGVAIAKWFEEFREGRIKFRGVEDLEKLLMIQSRLKAPGKGPSPSSVHQHLHVHQGGAIGAPGAASLDLKGKSQEEMLLTAANFLKGIERITGRPQLEAGDSPSRITVDVVDAEIVVGDHDLDVD